MGAAEKAVGACQVCKGRNYLVDRQGDWALARVCACSTPCPICDGQGFVYARQEETFSHRVGKKSYEVVAPCSCRLLEKRLQAFARAQIPGVVAHAQFENFRPSSEAQDRAREVARSFALGYVAPNPSRGFILGGPVGTGKTHLLAAALSHLVLETGVVASYIEISLLYATIRRGFQEGKSGGEIIGPLSEVDVLAIDELGKGRGSVFELETLEELIARRYNAGRTTLFATNFSLAPERKAGRSLTPGYRSTEETRTQARDSDLLKDRVGERIYSRLCEMCDFVEMPPGTPDHRRTRHELGSTPARKPQRR